MLAHPSLYPERNTQPLFALGIPQRLAEEIGTDLYAQRDTERATACDAGTAHVALFSKVVDDGTLLINRTLTTPCEVKYDAVG
jgi:hypothetical protein